MKKIAEYFSIKCILTILLTAVILEIFVFNFDSVVTCANKGTAVSPDNYGIDIGGIVVTDAGSVISDGSPYVEITGIDDDVHGVSVEMYAENDIPVSFEFSDEGCLEYYYAGSNNIPSGAKEGESRYFSLYPLGKLHSLKLYTSIPEGEPFNLVNVIINPPKPFHINLLRLVLLFMGILVCYISVADLAIWNITIKKGPFEGASYCMAIILIVSAIISVVGGLHMSRVNGNSLTDLLNNPTFVRMPFHDILGGIYKYLFDFPDIGTSAPLVRPITYWNGGFAYSAIPGGVIATNPILIMTVLLFVFKDEFLKRKLFKKFVVFLAVITALVVAVVCLFGVSYCFYGIFSLSYYVLCIPIVLKGETMIKNHDRLKEYRNINVALTILSAAFGIVNMFGAA